MNLMWIFWKQNSSGTRIAEEATMVLRILRYEHTMCDGVCLFDVEHWLSRWCETSENVTTRPSTGVFLAYSPRKTCLGRGQVFDLDLQRMGVSLQRLDRSDHFLPTLRRGLGYLGKAEELHKLSRWLFGVRSRHRGLTSSFWWIWTGYWWRRRLGESIRQTFICPGPKTSF